MISRQLVLENIQAPGDSLMFTCAVRDLHLQYPQQYLTSMATRSPEIWQGNPNNKNVDRNSDSAHLRVGYSSAIHQSNYRQAHFATGFCQDLGEKLGLRVPLTDMRPAVYLADAERDPQRAQVKGKYWIVMAGGKSDFTAKIWALPNWQRVASELVKDVQVVQAGAAGHLHKPLTGVTNLLGRTNFREFMSLVYHSQGIVCPVTCGMHLAAAFNKSCVVVAGGREPWWWEAYTRKTWAVNVPQRPCPPEFVDHTFLHTIGKYDCCIKGGCWRSGAGTRPQAHENCKYMAADGTPRCLSELRPEIVIAAVKNYMGGGAVVTEDLPVYLRPPLFTEPLPTSVRPVYIHPPTPKPREGQRFLRQFRRKGRVGKRCMLTHQKSQPVVVPNVPIVMPVTVIPVTKMLTQPKDVWRTPLTHVRTPFTVCALLYGDYLELARRCIQSVYNTVDPSLFEFRIGMNAVSRNVADWADSVAVKYGNVKLFASDTNIFKYPMMRRMFAWGTPDEMKTDWMCWMDDDSWVEPGWLPAADHFMSLAPTCQILGKRYFYHLKPGQVEWVTQAKWYTGKPIDKRKDIPVTHFATGGWWMARTAMLKSLDWPDPRLQNNGGDTNLGCACFQHGVQVWQHYKYVHISDAPRRGASQTHPGR